MPSIHPTPLAAIVSFTVAATLMVLPAGEPVAAAQVSLPLDCLPDQVVAWKAAPPDPELRFGATLLPGIVLGPPGSSGGSTGATTVASLGHGGQVTLGFTDMVIEDRPGPDFIVFENAFFVGAPPADAAADFFIFAEPATVEVSADGFTWFMFPYDSEALAATVGNLVSKTLFARLRGLAGVTPTFTGNWIEADDPAVWDSTGTGGVSGAGGDAFDLADVGLAEARFVRLTDAESLNGAAGSGEGFDLDALVALHGRPLIPLAPDGDEDRLSDDGERLMYATAPSARDSDLDGVDDGRELAGCSDPWTTAVTPMMDLEPRLVVRDGACTELRWTWPGSGRSADVRRGELAAVSAWPSIVDLGIMDCLATGQVSNTWACDSEQPLPGTAFFYLVQLDGGGLGRSSDLMVRSAGGMCP